MKISSYLITPKRLNRLHKTALQSSKQTKLLTVEIKRKDPNELRNFCLVVTANYGNETVLSEETSSAFSSKEITGLQDEVLQMLGGLQGYSFEEDEVTRMIIEITNEIVDGEEAIKENRVKHFFWKLFTGAGGTR